VSLLVLVPSGAERRALGLPDRDGVVVEVCGVGLVDAALGVERGLAATGAERCLLAGVAGTRDPARAPVGSGVVGRSVVNEGLGAGVGEGFVPLDEMDVPFTDLAPTTLALTVPAGGADVGARPGAIGTVAAAAATEDEARARRRRRPEVLAEEMEGWAVARVCAQHGVPLAVVRSISNVCGDRERGRWDLAGALEALSRALGVLVEAEW